MEIDLSKVSPDISGLLSQVKNAKIASLELEIDDFVLTCDSKEEMQNYIRFGRVKSIDGGAVILDRGYNINVINLPKVNVLHAPQEYRAAKDHFRYKVSDLSLTLMKIFLKNLELSYLESCGIKL